MNEAVPQGESTYPGAGHPWSDFLHHRARVIDWLYSGTGDPRCKDDDEAIAKALSMGKIQVRLIRLRDRSLTP